MMMLVLASILVGSSFSAPQFFGRPGGFRQPGFGRPGKRKFQQQHKITNAMQ